MKRVIIALCIVGMLLGVFMTFSASAHPGLDDVRAKHEPDLIAIQGVSGVASDKAKNELVVFVENKQVCDKVPKDLDGINVRCVETGRIEALPPAATATTSQSAVPYGSSYSRTGADNPVLGGISVGSAASPYSAGTIGLVTTKGQVLSCAHVLAMDSRVNFARLNTPVWQPGGYDGGRSANAIGTLTKYTPIQFSKKANNYADAAFATWSNPTGTTYTPNAVLNAASTGPITINGQAVANPNDIVYKSGRTTGVTTGQVQYTGATVLVSYGFGKTAKFNDQIVIVNLPNQPSFSAAGDSGSVIYNTNGQFVGLLFAGSNSITVANTAAHVTQALNIAI